MGLKTTQSPELKAMCFAEDMDWYRALNKTGDLVSRLHRLCEQYPKAEILLEYYPLHKNGCVYLDARIECSQAEIQKECEDLYDRYYFLSLLKPLK